MGIGNYNAQITLESNYVCLKLFPFCFEISITNIVYISIHVLSLTIRLTFSLDSPFFNN
jgi:hypothetical protein